jgi:hypothetical protein
MTRGTALTGTAMIAATAALAVALAGCTAPSAKSSSSEGADPGILPTASVKTPDLSRLADGLVPPTNRWFSGLVFHDQPVFPLPLSFQLTKTGFTMGVPTITASPDTIAAPAVADLTIDAGADTALVTRYDEVSVDIALSRGGDDIGTVTIARGSPVVSFVAASSVDLAVNGELGSRYGIATDGTRSEGRVSLADGEFVNLFAVPENGNADDVAEAASEPLSAVTTSWKGATTTLDYGHDVLVGALPHQREGLRDPDSCDLGSFETVLGTMELCATSRLSWSVDEVEPTSELDLSALSTSDTEDISAQIDADVAATPATPEDTYFGGKALARMATLLELARGVGNDAAAETLTKRLTTELTEWFDPDGCTERASRCFVYDDAVHGVVGQTAGFGSDEFNDHHFHYGYFLYAAGVVAAGNPDLVEAFSPVASLLAADIASAEGSSSFPQLRVFDPYSGHSWASGYSPFSDGNNQESSSEAVAAWNGLGLWARAAGDDSLLEQATWMLSAEAASARSYYLGAPAVDGFEHGVTGILWDGKRDSATWFSPEPSARLGIQLLPMGPYADYLGADPKRVRSNIAEVGEPGQFADYILMYSALAGASDASAALSAARDLPDASIDDGNSRAYMLAWIMAHARR